MYLWINVWANGDVYNKIFIIPLIIIFCAWAMHGKVSEINLFRVNIYKLLKVSMIVLFLVILISLNSYEIIKYELKDLHRNSRDIEKIIKNSPAKEKNIAVVSYEDKFRQIRTHWIDAHTDDVDPTQVSLSEHINMRLKENNADYTINFIIVCIDFKFKDYSGYKKIYSAIGQPSEFHRKIPFTEYGCFYGDLYIPDTEQI